MTQITAGEAHTLAYLSTTSTLYGWGWSIMGQIGTSNNPWQTLSPQPIPPLYNSTSAVSFYAGLYHSVMLESDSSLWTAGNNQYYQLCLQNNVESNNFLRILYSSGSGLSASLGLFHTILLSVGGAVFSCGY